MPFFDVKARLRRSEIIRFSLTVAAICALHGAWFDCPGKVAGDQVPGLLRGQPFSNPSVQRQLLKLVLGGNIKRASPGPEARARRSDATRTWITSASGPAAEAKTEAQVHSGTGRASAEPRACWQEVGEETGSLSGQGCGSGRAHRLREPGWCPARPGAAPSSCKDRPAVRARRSGRALRGRGRA